MMPTLAASSPAPKNTSVSFQRQIRSTKCPTGIFSAHGRPAQKPSAARNSAESPRYSLTKNVPTIPVRPEMPAARYTMSGGMYDHRNERASESEFIGAQCGG